MSFVWHVPPEQGIGPVYDEAVIRARAIAKQVLLSYAPRIETWMKQNARWQDRTGNARQGLYAEVEEFATSVSLIADHSMWYGYILETAHSGRFSIVAPAIDHFYSQIVADLRRIFS